MAGLSCGSYLHRQGAPFVVIEARNEVGGNARTLEHDRFRFDTGAHRFHEKDPEITADLEKLLGDELRQVRAPSRIYQAGRWVDFPLTPLNLLRRLGPLTTARACLDLSWRRWRGGEPGPSFEDFALRTYGRVVAERFLLNYTAKLWGVPCNQLSTAITGKRLNGLDLVTLLKEAVLGRLGAAEHLDGAFRYPRTGFGAIAEALALSCGPRIRTRCRVIRLFHEEGHITAVQLRDLRDSGRSETLQVDGVINTLPLPLVVGLLDPAPNAELLRSVARLRYRDLMQVALLLDKPRVSDNATAYFPDPSICFTRVTEPNNRSPLMSPPGKTSLVAELPCPSGTTADPAARLRLRQRVQADLQRIGWIRDDEVLGSHIVDLPAAYPILELSSEPALRRVRASLDGISNMRSSGRAARFAYTHCHDLMRQGKELANSAWLQQCLSRPLRAGRLSDSNCCSEYGVKTSPRSSSASE